MRADIGKAPQNQYGSTSVGCARIVRFGIGEPTVRYISFGGVR